MKYLFVSLFLLCGLMSFGQHPGGGKSGGGGKDKPAIGVVTGFVFEKESKKPIEFANIVIYSKKDSSIVSGGITDSKGYFSIDEVRYGKFYVEVNFIGYGKSTINDLMVRPDNYNVDLGKIHLAMSAEMLNEVNIEANVNQVDYRLDKKVINVNQDLVAAGGTAVDVLENVPSVETDIDGNVSLRGTESFLVLIDGRPSPLQGSDALQQIPSTTIESIEIITNPSAKYDPDGVGGIINIILVKEKRKGYNGQISAKYGSFNSYGGDALFNFRTEKFNVFIGGNYNLRINEGSGLTNRETYLNPDTTLYLNTSSDAYRQRKSGSVRAGLDYYINDKDVITVSGKYGLSGFGMGSDSWAETFYKDSGIFFDEYYYLTQNDFFANRSYFSGDINYMKKFKKDGHELQVYGSYSSDIEEEENQYNEQETDYNQDPISDLIGNYRTIESGKGSGITAKADYVLPLFKQGKFEAGYQLKYSSLDNQFDYQALTGDTWITDPAQANPYIFSRNVQSGYALFSDYLGKFGYQVGLRTEYTDRLFKQTDSGQEWKYNKFDFFPSIHTSYKLPADMQVMASYSRRLDRPRGYYLDPFVEVVSPNSVKMGNPELLPEYTNSYELNFQKKFKANFVSFELYARQTNNKINRITVIDPVSPDIFISTFDNIGNDLAAGGELMLNLNLTKWYNLNVSGTGYYYEIISDEYVDNSTFTYRARINNTFRLKKSGTSLQIGGFYNGPSISAQGSREAMYMVQAGVRQDFFDRKLSISANVRDVFGTMSHVMISESDLFYQYRYMDRKSPTFRISVTYKINDFKNRKDGSGEVEVEEM